MKPKLFFPQRISINLIDVVRWAIIVATTIIRILPNQTVASKHKALQPFFMKVKEEISYKLRYNLVIFHARIKHPAVFTHEIVCDCNFFLITHFYNMSAPSAYKVNHFYHFYFHNLNEQICIKKIRAQRRFYALINNLIFLLLYALINTLIFLLTFIFDEKFRPAKMSPHEIKCDSNHIFTVYSYNTILNIFFS